MFYQEYRNMLLERQQAKGLKSFLIQRKLDKKRGEFLKELPQKYGNEYQEFFRALLYTIEQHPEKSWFKVEFWDTPRLNEDPSPIQKWVDTDSKKRKETLQIMSHQWSHYGEYIDFQHSSWWDAWVKLL